MIPSVLQQLMKTLCAAMEPQDAGSGAVEVGHGEHLAAAVAIADPVDEVVSPIDGLGDMGKGETITRMRSLSMVASVCRSWFGRKMDLRGPWARIFVCEVSLGDARYGTQGRSRLW